MTGDRPWPQIPVGNKDHGSAAVVIIGGGISGMCTAIDLIKRNNCRNFIIVEKSAGLGGTWLDNKYPGCCCDVLSQLYSFSFRQNTNWTRWYPGQEEILAYLVNVAQEYQLYQHFRFNTSVEHATWDESTSRWRVHVKTAPGTKEAEFSPEYDIVTDFLISAVGQLNVPQWPKIDGIDSFAGKTMHSARWDWSYDITDRKIALVGNGCSAVQILPEIAKAAKQVTVFQRTPNWIVPRQDAPISPTLRRVFTYVPGVLARVRAMLMDFRENAWKALVIPGSDDGKVWMQMGLDMMHAQLPDQPELWEKLTPKYNIGCKRVIASDDYYPTLNQDHVTLETRPIHSIDGHAVKVTNAAGATETVADDFDLLVCATGFQSLEFMHPIQLYGRGGRALRGDVWKDGARALYGMTVEDMPNFALLYGPNTNLGHNSIILMIEAQSQYINAMVGAVLAARQRGQTLSLTPRRDRIEEFNVRIQRELKESSFNDPKCSSWYKNEAGLITNNWSRTVVEYQKEVSKLAFDDFETEGSWKQWVREGYVRHLGRVREESIFSDRSLLVMGAVSTAAVIGGVISRFSGFSRGLKFIGF